MKRVNRNEGFSIIELMIVVGLIGILALIAIPSIMGYRHDTADGMARTAIEELRILQARYYQDYGTFTDNLQALIRYNKGIQEYVDKGVNIVLVAADQDGYTIQADRAAKAGTKRYEVKGPRGLVTETNL